MQGRPAMVLDWSVRLYSGKLLDKQRTQAKTASAARRKAKRTAAEMLAAGGQRRPYAATTPIEKFLDEAVAKEITESGRRPATLQQYRRVLGLLRKQLRGHSISSAWHYDVLTDALTSIAAANGTEAARHSLTVTRRYATQPLLRYRLIDRDPLADVRLDFSKYAPAPDDSKPKRGGRGLTADEQERTIAYLLSLDPAEGVKKPARGRWTLDDAISMRRNVIDLTLLQAGGAPRIKEALLLTGELLYLSDDGVLHLNITREISKTGIARQTPIPDPRIAERLLARRDEALEHGGYLIGRATNPQLPWPPNGGSGAGQKVAELYKELAEKLDMPLLQHLRTHLWRTTLSSRYAEAGVSREVYSTVLGHDETTNLKSYTDRSDTDAISRAYRQKHTKTTG